VTKTLGGSNCAVVESTTAVDFNELENYLGRIPNP
jgi:hypothetical protein